MNLLPLNTPVQVVANLARNPTRHPIVLATTWGRNQHFFLDARSCTDKASVLSLICLLVELFGSHFSDCRCVYNGSSISGFMRYSINVGGICQGWKTAGEKCGNSAGFSSFPRACDECSMTHIRNLLFFGCCRKIYKTYSWTNMILRAWWSTCLQYVCGRL